MIHKRKKEKKPKGPSPEVWDRLLLLYYRLRRRSGLEEIPAERLRQQALLHPEMDGIKEAQTEDRKRLKLAVCCMTATLLLTAAVGLQSDTEFYTMLDRPGYGEDTSEKVLDLAVDGREYQIPVLVDSQSYTAEELEILFEKAWEAVKKQVLAGNPDWEHISEDLNFDEETGIPGISVEWNSGDVDVISVDGAVAEPARADRILETDLTATLIYEEEERQYTVHGTVVCPDLTATEAEERSLKNTITEALKDRRKAQIVLPSTLGDEPITYERATGRMPLWLVPLLGVFAVAALWMLPEQQRKEALANRDRELALSYSELVWKLTVLLGAGMTMKGAWERILRSYQEKRQNGAEAEVLYEEMQMTWNSMSQGVFEEKAYAQFGRRCGLQPYLRLGSLLETNVRQGRKGLAEQMQKEADAAFRERLQLARKQGEEASSKLLMPMMLLFGLVLVILMVPALSQFG